MKNWLIVVAVLATANIAVAGGAFRQVGLSKNSNMMLEAVESLSNDEHECFSGGPGSSSCSIGGGVGVRSISKNKKDVGIDYNCSVSCKEGYYACCGIRCTCVKEP